MSNDGISSRVGNHQQSNYGAHEMSYFDQGMSRSQPTEIDPQSHPLQSSEGSPPPNSSTAPGSSASTSTSLEISDQPHGSTSSQYSQLAVAEGMITKPYDDTDTSQTATSHAEKAVDIPISQSQEGKQNPTAYQSAIKLLVSNNVAGSIIGRAGQTISDLQTQSSARIKLSQTGDYYPGTQDRVCLVQGQPCTVKLAVQLLLERFYMLQQQQHTQHLAWQPRKGPKAPTGFDFVVRLLLPSSSCGMIIGKGGANIKHMEESSGVSSVRLSPKEGPDQTHPTAAVVSGTLERVVTLTGPTMDSCVKCLFIVIDCMFANHEICRYTNMTTSYSRHVAPGTYTSVQPGRPLHTVPSPTGEWDTQGPYGSFMIKRSTSQPDLSHMPMEQQRRMQSRIPPELVARVGSQQIGQREPSVQQFNPPFIDPPQPYNSEMPPMLATQDRGQRSNTQIAPMYLLGGPTPGQLDHPPMQSSSSAPDLLALQFHDSLHISNSQTGPVDYNHFAPQLPQPTRPGFAAQVLVPDTLIGSILGRGGRALNELQSHSNTRIRISQRGEYVPGTRNRIVTIRGQTAHSVSLAQYLMSQRMVLLPTAGFSAQTAPLAPASYLHPSQLQLPPQRIPLHQSPHTGPLDSPAPSTAPQQQHQVLHETAFLPSEPHPTGAAASSLTLSLNSPDNDLTSHR